MRANHSAARPLFRRRKLARLAGGFAVALALVYLLGVVVGWGATLTHLDGADLGWIGVASLSTVLCLGAWAKTWQVVLSALDISVAYRRLLVAFVAGAFANYVTPMGQAGGEPFVAYVLARETDVAYERSLASVVVSDILRLLPFFSVAVIGVGYLLVETGLPGPAGDVVAVFVSLAVFVPAGVAGLWRYRRVLRRWILSVVDPLAERTDRFTRAGIAQRIDRFYESVQLIAGNRRAVVYAVVFSYLGWILFALPLYFSALSLGLSIELVLVCVLVPLAVVAGSTPLPGGLAAIEGSLVALLTVLVSVSASRALAVTTVYRLTSYWLVVAIGGIAALWLLFRS